MIVTSNEKLAERLKAIRAHGMRKRYYHDELGVNVALVTPPRPAVGAS